MSSCASVEQTALEIGEKTGNETLIKATADLTPKQEHYLGRSIFARVLAERSTVKSDALQIYINQVGQYLAMHSSRPMLFNGYRFIVTEDSIPNAMSAPGGFVAISSSMLQLVRNEDELAGVLAHEIAHIALKHAEENIKNSNRLALGTQLLAIIASASPNTKNVSVFSEAVAVGLDARFNQNQESEADASALRIMDRAGYAPRALYRVVKRIPENSQILGKHPRTEDRLDNIKRLSSRTKKRINLEAKKRYISFQEKITSKSPPVRY